MAQTLLAVYRDTHHAEAAAEALKRQGARVIVDDPEDARQAVLAEMDAEAAESWASPGIGVLMTKNMARSALMLIVGLGAIGAPVGALVGWLLFDHSSVTWERLAIGAALGAVFFATVGALIGGGLGVHAPDAPLAGEAGVPVRVDAASGDAIDVLKRFEPIRVDLLEDGERRDTPVTEAPHGVEESIRDVAEGARDPRQR